MSTQGPSRRLSADKMQFALKCLGARLKGAKGKCPFCSSEIARVVGTKLMLLEARSCASCGLIYRWPCVSPQESAQFYEKEYQGGVVTDIPTDEKFAEWKRSGFQTTPYDASYYLKVLTLLNLPEGRLLDLGCSWGYYDYQFREAGYSVEGFEISRARGKVGVEKLGLTIHSDWASLLPKKTATFDIIFTAHVLEHLADLGETLRKISELTKKGGKLLAIVPNGNTLKPTKIGPMQNLGKEHIIAFTAEWFQKNLPALGWRVEKVFSSLPGGILTDTVEGNGLITIATRVDSGL